MTQKWKEEMSLYKFYKQKNSAIYAARYRVAQEF